MKPAIASEASAPVRPIHGRYRVEAELARGAMGAVYRVFDLAAKRTLALKRSLGGDRKFLGMFEREYHTLLGLKHPCIIEVYDYGVDEQGAYYTMELLAGSDLAELAPVDYRQACRYLRDVASSLGLLHARRMLHRDLSPRNVRVAESGRCKLIDFGVLSGFGVPELVVGTPPFIPPESLHRLALDQRADLFALGAVAYSLLTGTYAYPARSLAELSEVWRKLPARPSEVAAKRSRGALPAIPAELDELVMSLLTLEPLGRPASAAEVIDRLSRIGDLEQDAQAGAASRSYLLGVQTVGRTRELGLLSERLGRALEGRGACVLIETRAGMGSTRVISDLAVEAQLAGALPIVIDAAAHSDSFGAVHDLIDKLLTSSQEHAVAAARGHEALLARLSPALRELLAVEPDATDFSATPSELRRRLLAALGDWIGKLCERRAILLAVDNVHALDDASGALFAALGAAANKAKLLLLVCVKTELQQAAPASVRALLQSGTRQPLGALDAEHVSALVRLWFGDVEGTARLADRLHRVSGGNVRACSELAEHLVRTRVVRDIQGAWVLPSELSASDLPASADALQTERARGLPDPERRLAEALAVHRGQVSLALCLEIAVSEGIAETYVVLGNLVHENVLHNRGDAYALSYEPLREALLAQLPRERKRELHLRMGAALAAMGGRDIATKLGAGWHLLHGGEQARGAALLAAAGLSLGYSSDDLASAVPALRAALDVYRNVSYSDYDRIHVLAPLALASVFADRRLGSEYGVEAIATFERVVGLSLYHRLAPWVGRHLAFFASLGFSAVRFALRLKSGGIAGFRAMLVQCMASATSLCATAAVCLDAARARHIADRLEPLRILGEDTGAAYAHRFTRLLATVPTEHVSEMISEARAVLARLDDPRPIRELPPHAREALRAGVLQLLGALELFCADSQTLAIAERLESTGMAQDRATADQLRLSHHALRGEAKLAHAYAKKVELQAIQGGMMWVFEVWSPSFFILVYCTTLDMIGMKHVAERLDRLAREVPTLRNDAIMVNAEYQHLKGNHEAAFALSRPVLEATQDRGFIGRSNAMATYCRALNHLGRHAEAKATIEPMIARLTEADRRVSAFYVNLYREYALALAGLNDFEQAFAVLDENLARYAPSEQPLLLGNLHATATTVAIAAGDGTRALQHLGEMGRWFRATENPVLVAQCEKLSRQVRAMPGVTSASVEHSLPSPANDQRGDDLNTALSRISQLTAAEDRAEFALRLLLEHVNAHSGYLFVNRRGTPALIAPLHGEEPSPTLLVRVAFELSGAEKLDEQTVATSDHGHLSDPALTQIQHVVHVLRDDERVLGALAARLPEDRTLRGPRAAFLNAVATALFQALEAGGAMPATVNVHPERAS